MGEIFYKVAGALIAPFRYADREVQRFKAEAKEDLQAFIAKMIKMVILSIASLLFLLFLSIFAATAINNAMNSTFIGFAIVAGFYLLCAVGVYISKEVSDKKREAEDMQKHMHLKKV